MEPENEKDGVPDVLRAEFYSRWKVYSVFGLVSASLGALILGAAVASWPANWYGKQGLVRLLEASCSEVTTIRGDQLKECEKNASQAENDAKEFLFDCRLQKQYWQCQAGKCSDPDPASRFHAEDRNSPAETNN